MDPSLKIPTLLILYYILTFLVLIVWAKEFIEYKIIIDIFFAHTLKSPPLLLERLLNSPLPGINIKTFKDISEGRDWIRNPHKITTAKRIHNIDVTREHQRLSFNHRWWRGKEKKFHTNKINIETLKKNNITLTD